MGRPHIVILAALLFANRSGLADQLPSDARNAIGVLAEGYERNREAFTVIDCRFDWRRDKAVTREDAFQGKLVGDGIVQHAHWLVHGKKERFELRCEPEVLAKNQETLKEFLRRKPKRAKGERVPGSIDPDDAFAVDCSDRFILRSDTYSLGYGPFILCANLFGPTDMDGARVPVNPFNIEILGDGEVSNPARYLRDCLNGRFEGQFLGEQTIHDVKMLVVQILVDKKPRNRFGFDPARGYLLTYASDTDPRSGNRYYEMFVTESRQCSGERWFPTRVLKIINPDNPPPFYVDQISVLDLNADEEPPASTFRLKLTAGTQVNVIGRPEWLNLEKSETLSPDDLPTLHQRAIDHGRAETTRSKRRAQTARGKRLINRVGTWKSLVIVNATILAVLMAFYLVRRRKLRRNAK